ncbi:GPW/gp25 family protein [Cupriavidus oxalaticus]|uniref:GPW/gp25 family protein n=1 Tax=Cupriavidus oxalaticus TaxID=96344 RepID=A0A976BBM9_9BURK|nr:GPW/gp25 family protein [Cupriavidus oxalaticus]QRQ88509.1 GPW/gp25 family protein [Cupriavidus oxalaticus]QRQ93165.1 GPW/gp25 family protein [Cupriavidus oxalaticus]WQD81775.1 GPW/gp25 family protein [Cupriavidus oxalaticus]SPC13145.1 putative phage-related protein (Baseplate assembly-like protein) [Cupriavidus oxalaticus]
MTYAGLNSATGLAISDLAHIWQSIRDILTTPVGTRVMRRAYGSEVPMLIDQPLNGMTRLRVMSAAVAAIVRWEPRVQVNAVSFVVDGEGSMSVDLDADRIDGPRSSPLGKLSIPLREAKQ